MVTTEIQHSILLEYHLGKPLAITNYAGITGFEGDVVMIAKSGFVYEYEVKSSRADFKKDFSKISKHKHLQNPKVSKSKYSTKYPQAPNYFYYVCIDGLIKKNEIPKYAGLIYIINGVPVVQVRAKRLHSFKVTEHLKNNLAIALSTRTIKGSSYIRYRHSNK